MANLGVSKMNSPWTRSCERKWQVVGGVTSGKKNGVNIQGRILFKQSKIVNRASGTPKCNRKRLNFKSNIAGIVKLVNTLQLRDEHMIFLRKTPFWLMFEAILINQLDHTKFQKGDDLLVNIIQAYNSRDGVFHIGGHSVSVVDEDIRLIFGIQCGTGFLDLTPRPKPPSNFIQWRCRNTNRITSKLVRNLLVEAVVGSTDRDVEDTAKLLCLYACEKLFFSNSEETISWALIRYVDNLEAMRTYDWTGAIRSSLMCSIRNYHRTPEKVTGCVVALMYWLCEHTKIIKPVSDSAFPRFLKWDITKLINAARGVKLTGHVEFEVTVGRLTAREHEVAILEADRLGGLGRAGNVIDGDNANVQDDDFEVGNVGVDVTRVGVELIGRNGECGSSSMDMPPTVKDPEKKLESHRVDSVPGLCAQTKTIAEVEMEINTKDTVIAELRAEVEKLRRTNDTQTLHLVGGFGTLLHVKDDELKKLRTENIELRRALAVYEEQFAEREVHNVTQAFCDAGPGCNVATEDNIIDLTDVATNHEQYAVNGNQVSVLEVTPIAEQTNEDTIMRPIVEAQTDVIVISPIMAEGGRDICGPNSFVRNIKCKVRKELKMSGFEYQELRGRTVNKGVVAGSATMADVGCSRERAAGKGVIDVDEVVVCLNKKSGFDINNRHSVWKMMTVEEKSKISNAYNVYGDRAVIWDGHEHGVAVYFTDVKALVRQSEIRGNVIDAYTVLLSAEQDKINEGVEVLEKSYFFSSICLGMIKNTNIRSRDKYIMDNLNAAKLFRYVHFPICKESHWTLVVYDTKDGSWKHFNSMRTRGGIVDVHYTEALFVKDVVSEVQRQALRDCWVDIQDFNNPLESVVDCPQQRPDSLDCAVIVCAVMRQYVHHVDVGRSLHDGNCSVLRATMVKAFINDPVRGLKNDTD